MAVTVASGWEVAAMPLAAYTGDRPGSWKFRILDFPLQPKFLIPLFARLPVSTDELRVTGVRLRPVLRNSTPNLTARFAQATKDAKEIFFYRIG
jgi:hypothetical protein